MVGLMDDRSEWTGIEVVLVLMIRRYLEAKLSQLVKDGWVR
jgi:hypothetical protein